MCGSVCMAASSDTMALCGTCTLCQYTYYTFIEKALVVCYFSLYSVLLTLHTCTSNVWQALFKKWFVHVWSISTLSAHAGVQMFSWKTDTKSNILYVNKMTAIWNCANFFCCWLDTTDACWKSFCWCCIACVKVSHILVCGAHLG